MTRTSAVAVLLALLVLAVGCSRPTTTTATNTLPGSSASSGAIQVKGSDTMANVGQAWAEAFYNKTGTQVAITGGGSGTGIAAMLNGTCDVANSSREMEGEELTLAAEKGLDPQSHVAGLDGLAVVVNPENPVSELTIDQLADIFTGRVTNWRDVGGEDSAILILSREVNSGTHVYFKERVLRGGDKHATDEFDPGALHQPSSQSIADEVSQNKKAIGYYGMGYISPGQKPIAVADSAGAPYVVPTPENVLNGTYSISRPLFLYTNGAPQGNVKAFIDFVLGPEGQQILEDQEFVPAPADAPNESAE